jgi:HD-GYP domain-containing protein (c-di-GMP phosphodiesterase class II)
MDQLLHSLSLGLDAVEKELVGVATNHGKRVAVLTAAMGRELGWDDHQLLSITACALMHDNALTESLAERKADGDANLLASHCIKGEWNASHLPFPTDITGVIAFHHEYMDGSGPFGKRGDETPAGAQLIALADHLDIHHRLSEAAERDLDALREAVARRRGNFYSPLAADALLSALDAKLLESLRDENVNRAYDGFLPWIVDADTATMMNIARMVAAITDYKSAYTAKHSLQIANRAWYMAGFYGFDTEKRAKIYLAAALHDVGKLVTPVAILDKPGKLDDREFEIITRHVWWSYFMLKDVEGLEEICRWAVTHHRKLTGRGYPDLPAEYLDMDFVSRMMACIDIYQAVREARPYHPERTHRETMDIMWEMADKGEIDRQITADMDSEMARFTEPGGEVPDPL